MRILLTEDDLGLAENLKKMLQDNHFSVDVCHDGQSGLFQLVEYPYDLAIIDIGLPKKDGMSLLEKPEPRA